ncbi:helix-turn-helix transcriptional regulator [Nocardioides mangrovi]|uniref:YafY family transcriptional regulator n=1 Tax=Nocardioides mangrovi TaxID=2874580 RepID=A0ABS7UBH9_9ACTN|nr:YafY family protein [Nocardioides mangrovi]MBZ5738353.1 YafY family transcriptional regulator [Nocardioides mangrovi]
MSTSARMLRLLSLLQTHRYWPGAELSQRLEVSPRTLRRDIDRLRELGYAVDAVRGVAGGYQLRAGGELPPLLLEDEEAVAVAVALRAAASGGEDTSLQALTKVIALMPPRLRRQMDALRSQTDGVPWAGAPSIDAATLTTLAQACRDDEPVAFSYVARDGGDTRRRVEPHRLVSVGRRWYLVAYDRDRQDWRSFRVDRVSAVETSGQRFRPRELPADDAPAFVQAGIRSMATRYDVRLRLALPADVAEADLGRWATVTPDGEGCRVRMLTDTLDWPLMVLARLDVDFTVEAPPELARLVASAGERFGRAVPVR